MCLGLKVWCNVCHELTRQTITRPCEAGSRQMPGSDFRDSSTLQCKGSGCVDYTERTIQNCDSCYRAWRICRYQDLQLVKSVLESLQHELERPWKLSEEDETDPDPKKARQARRNRLLKADTAIALQIVKRQARGLQNQVRAEQFIAEVRIFALLVASFLLVYRAFIQVSRIVCSRDMPYNLALYPGMDMLTLTAPTRTGTRAGHCGLGPTCQSAV